MIDRVLANIRKNRNKPIKIATNDMIDDVTIVW